MLRKVLLGLLIWLCIGGSAMAGEGAVKVDIEGKSFNPANLITGEWLGEAGAGGVEYFGVNALSSAIAFFDEAELNEIALDVFDFETHYEIHAIHLHGIGNDARISKLYGYSLIVGDEQSQRYTMKTYVRSGQQFVVDDDLTNSTQGALDCDSAALLAVLHGPASQPLVIMTLGKTEYIEGPQSELKFTQYLRSHTHQLAEERRKVTN